jgi:hypothetical protein
VIQFRVEATQISREKLKRTFAKYFECSENKFVLLPLKEGEVSSYELHCMAEKATTVDELLSITDKFIPAFLSSANKSGPHYYKALASFLSHRIIEFQFHYRSYVIVHYFLIIDHLFAPSKYASEMTDLESVLTINRGLVMAFLPSQIRKNRVQANTRFYWFPCIKEIIRGLEYLAKLYTINEAGISAGKRFTTLLSACTQLNVAETEALWQFRCGLVHSGTLYNKSLKGEIYRFRVDALEDARVIFEPKEKLEHLEGNRYYVNLSRFEDLFEDAQQFVHQDIMNNIGKYAFSEKYHEWVQTHWSLSYLPTINEMGKKGAQPRLQKIPPEELSKQKMAHSSVVYEKKYCLKAFIGRLLAVFRKR